MTGYIFTHEGNQFDPNGRTSVTDPAEHNKQLERAELARWQEKPEQALAYIVKRDGGKYVPTTCLGTELGTIVETRRHRNNLTGSRMEYVRIRGNNGALYYGTYGCDWSQAVRLRKAKQA
jgi:hypothetical protein